MENGEGMLLSGHINPLDLIETSGHPLTVYNA